VALSLRLSPEVVAHFRATGPGWQRRIDEALKDWVAGHRDAWAVWHAASNRHHSSLKKPRASTALLGLRQYAGRERRQHRARCRCRAAGWSRW